MLLIESGGLNDLNSIQ